MYDTPVLDELQFFRRTVLEIVKSVVKCQSVFCYLHRK